MENQQTIARQITNLKRELAALDAQRDALKNKITQLQNSLAADTEIADPTVAYGNRQVTGEFSETEKIALFRSLFRGREDVFPKRFESKRTGKSGYQPSCNNEWIRPICKKPKVKCGECENRDFRPVTNEVIRNHLLGREPNDRYQREFVIGVYSAIHEMYASLINDAKRNQMIVKDVLAAVSKKRFPVILTERKVHLEMLRDMLCAKIPHVIVMKGGMGKKQRENALNDLEQLKDDNEKVVLANGRYLGE